MNIAVIGWGSLIWSPGSLLINSLWHREGPELPIEFSRISMDGRITLTITPNKTLQKSYWAYSFYEDLDEARNNLMHREGAKSLFSIPFIRKDGKVAPGVLPAIKKIIQPWLDEQDHIDAVIWTGFLSNWKKQRGCKFALDDLLAYLEELQLDDPITLGRVKEYVTNTPSQIQPELRRIIQEEFGWQANPLSPVLFVD